MDEIQLEKKKVIRSLMPGLVFVLVLWAIALISYGLDISLTHFGVYPRRLLGLTGIVTSVFIHKDLQHLLHNTFPLLVLLAFVFYFHRKIAVVMLSWLYIIAGLWTWSLGRSAYHIGASGLIYGLVSFIFVSGVLRRDRASLALSLFTVFFYGSLIWGVLPLEYEVSWEGHLSGGLAGVMLAFYYRNYDKPAKVKEISSIAGKGIDLNTNATSDAANTYHYKYHYVSKSSASEKKDK